MSNLKVDFPMGKIYVMQNKKGDMINSAYIEWNQSYENKLNKNFDQVQIYTDNLVVSNLQRYVSKKTGVQEKSIRLGTKVGSGEVWIAVPYARYQAYSKKIHKLKGLRGPRPFERMKADKGENILRQVSAYSRRLNG